MSSLDAPLDDVVHAGGDRVGHGHDQVVAVLEHGARRGQLGLPEADQPRRAGAGGRLELGELPPDPDVGDGDPHEQHLPGGLAPHLADLDREQLAQQPVHRPRHRRHARDAHALVDLGALLVVDAGDDVLDAERLTRDAGADDVGVVAAAHGGEGPGRGAAGVEQGLPVEAEPGDLAAGEVRAQPAEGLRVLVDHRDAVADLLEAAGDGGADAPAAHHDHVHVSLLDLCAWRRTATRSRPAKLHPVRGGQAAAGRPSADVAWHTAEGRQDGPRRPYHRAVPSLSDLGQLPKRLVLGRPVRSDRAGESLLPKRLALPIFASDALSSVAYATQEILIVLTLGGVAYLCLAPWLAAGVVVLLTTVVLSYRQVVHAYPSGGGDYEGAMKNHGQFAALVVASALLTDYVLTVAVSVSSGTDNVISAFPQLNPHRVVIAVGLVVLLAAANLRGIRESGTAFAVPTYLFAGGVFVMIVTGLIRQFFGSGIEASSAHYAIEPEAGYASLSGLALIWLALRAFASGTTALTGIEAVANGVPAFKPPKSRNAATTLGLLGAMACFMFAGVTALAL